MSTTRFENYSLLLLRLMLVFIFLFHGIPKAMNWALASDKFIGMGYPGFLGPITGIVEVIASVLLLFGLFPTFINLLFAGIMIAAIVSVHIPGSFAAGTITAGLERDLMLLVGLIIGAVFGPGQFSPKSSAAKG